MKPNGLGKSHKLCAKVAIDRLFSPAAGASTALCYPLRAVWAENPGRQRGEKVQFLISVPKKRLRHAVDRVAMRRKIRESYRLQRSAAVPEGLPIPVDVAFVYIADTRQDYERVDRAMRKLLKKIFPE